jgi:pyrroline-5-carboxylate reductase
MRFLRFIYLSGFKIIVMAKNKIAIIGAGNIGTSLAKGLIRSGAFDSSNIILTDKRESRISILREDGFNATGDNRMAASEALIVVISVKPQQFGAVAGEIKDVITSDKILISTVTGITHKDIESAISDKVPNVRIMPNTALEICQSMTCLSFSRSGSEHKQKIISLFGKMGKTIVIQEELMGAATVIGACGIAFALRFMRAMSQGGIEIGFNSEISQLITAQTMKGAAGLILETTHHPEMEIDKVTTPQGITISGLNEMEHQGLSSAVIKGLTTSFSKIENMQVKGKNY